MAEDNNKKPKKIESPFEKAKQALHALTGTPVIDVDSYVNDVLKNTEKRMEQQYAWMDVIQNLERNSSEEFKKTTQNFVDDIVQNSGQFGAAKRNGRYREYVSAVKKLPVLFKMIRVYAANIMSPDDITKFAFKYMITDSTLEDNPEHRSIQQKYKLISKTIDLEKYTPTIVTNTLLLGDMYVEIIASKRYLMQTLLNLQIPIGEAQDLTSSIKESTRSSSETVDLTSKKNFKLIFEETNPIGKQIKSINECLAQNLSGLTKTHQSLKLLQEDVLSSRTDGELKTGAKEDKKEGDTIQHLIDILPVKGTMANVNIRVHKPHRIIKLENDEICYGYLYLKEGNAVDNSTMTGAGSQKDGSIFGVKAITDKLSQYIRNKFSDQDNMPDVNSMAPGLQELIADILLSGSTETTVRYIPPSNMQHFKISGTGFYDPYGESILDNLMFRATLLLADDVASVVYNIANTGKRTVYTVRANTHQQAANRIQEIKQAVTKRTVTLDKMGSIEQIPTIISGVENFYISKVNDEPNVEINTQDLGTYQDKSDPNMYQLKQLITGGDVPPPHLGFEEWVNSKATLSSESVVFARNIIEHQKELSIQFTELMQKIYRALFLNTKEFDIAYLDVAVVFNPPRAILLESESAKASNMQTIVDALTALEVPKDKIMKVYWPELLDEESKIKEVTDKLKQKSSGGDQSGGDMGGDTGFASFGGDGGDLSMSPPGEEAPPSGGDMSMTPPV